MIDREHGWNTSFKPLYLGFTLSVIFIAAAYRLVTRYHLPEMGLIYTLMTIAVIQAVVQFVFFLHLGMQMKTHWYLITFLFTLLVMIIVVAGSMWIMQNISHYETPTFGQ